VYIMDKMYKMHKVYKVEWGVIDRGSSLIQESGATRIQKIKTMKNYVYRNMDGRH
jgi:hypothetical protein